MPILSKFEARGVRKVTIGITGLWPPSVHSDVAFWSFDVGSSYHCEAEFTKCRIVHPLCQHCYMNFLVDLHILFNRNYMNLKQFITDITRTDEIELDCSHSVPGMIPNDETRCYYLRGFGTNNQGKGMTIRKSTIWEAGLGWKYEILGIVPTLQECNMYPDATSTKVDVCMLLLPLAYPDDDFDQMSLDFVQNNRLIRHRCGCGCLDRRSCCNVSHIEISSQWQNRNDTAYHLVLKHNTITAIEYRILVDILRDSDQDVF